MKPFLLLVAVTLSTLAPPVGRAADLVIHGANVIPMTDDTVVENAALVVREGKIAAICPLKDQCWSESAEIIDGRGKFLIPGLTDMHAHLAMADFSAMEIPLEVAELSRDSQRQRLLQYLIFGVTTVRDPAGLNSNLALRDAIASGDRAGPRLFTANIPMDGEPSLHPATTSFPDPAGAAQFVNDTAAAGYDMVKIYSTLSVPTFDAIAKAANAAGIPFGGHVPMPVPLEHALEQGMRSIEHLSGYDVACADGIELAPTMEDVYQGWSHCTPEKMRALAELTARFPVWVDPTLIVVEGVLTEYDRHENVDEEQRRHIPPVMLSYEKYLYDIFSPRSRAGLKGTRNVRLALTRALADAGVPILVGTDTMASGYDVHQEMALLAEAGLTPYQILTAATSEPARYFEREGDFGTIEVGASGDLLLLNANPLEDITNAKKIRGVMVRGEWWPRSRLDAEYESIQKEYAESRNLLSSP